MVARRVDFTSGVPWHTSTQNEVESSTDWEAQVNPVESSRAKGIAMRASVLLHFNEVREEGVEDVRDRVVPTGRDAFGLREAGIVRRDKVEVANDDPGSRGPRSQAIPGSQKEAPFVLSAPLWRK
eukprot:5700337-Lingulodinium_polyedra.AAC.1